MKNSSSTSSSDGLLFCLRFGVFLAPVVAFFALPFAVFVASGELAGVDVERVLLAQGSAATANSEALFGLAYSECDVPYKFRGVANARPETLILGTSRLLGVRADLFREPAKTYNAARGVARASHLAPFLAALEGDGPLRTIVLGVDHYFFNPAWDRGQGDGFRARLTARCSNALNLLQSASVDVYRDVFAGKVPLVDVLLGGPFQGGYGLSARVHEEGFRRDGSFRYSAVRANILDPQNPDHGFADTFARIARGDARYQRSDRLSAERVAELVAFLDLAKERGLHVVGVVPPYAPTVLTRLREDGGYGYLSLVGPALTPLFRERGFELYDLTDVAQLGATDEDFIDGIHATERMTERIIRHVASESRRLNALLSPP